MKKMLLICILIFNYLIAHAAVYAQLSGSAADDLQPIAGIISGIDWDEKQKVLTIKEEGVYTIMSNLQYSAKEGGDFYYWLEANGKPLMDTRHQVSVAPLTKSDAVAYSAAVPLAANTQLRFIFSTTADISLIHFPATQLHPAAPGLTVSIIKIGNEVPYL